MWRKLITFLFVLGAILLGVGSAAAQEKSYSADRFDVHLQVQNDGSMLVTETVDFNFVGEPFTFVFRELPTDLTDGITILAASVDGRLYPRGSSAGQVEVEQGRDIRVTWHLEPTANVTRTFVLEYQILGVVQQSGGVDLLRYQPLPESFEYTIDNSSITLSYPNTAVLQAAPTITIGNAQVSRSDNVVTFTQQNIAPDETLVFEMAFNEGSLIATPPEWQARQAKQNALAPWWIGGSLFILLTGGLAAVWIWRSHQPALKAGTAVQFEPPSKLAPAIAGVLNGTAANPTWPNALATLFDLADRDILSIEEVDEKKWYRGHDFSIILKQEPSDLRPHEQGLLDLLFETKEGRKTAVKLSTLANAISGKRWKKYTEPLKAELIKAGYIDEERKTRRQWIIAGGVLLLIPSTMLLIAIPLALQEPFGAWPFTVVAALFLVCVILFSLGSSLTILTDDARQLANEWQHFYQYLKDVTRKKAAVGSTEMFTQFLPYAATYGLLHQWAKFFQREGWTELPPYFQAINRTGHDGMAAFVAMTATSSSSGGSAAGGAGGGGAAGGGASGAG